MSDSYFGNFLQLHRVYRVGGNGTSLDRGWCPRGLIVQHAVFNVRVPLAVPTTENALALIRDLQYATNVTIFMVLSAATDKHTWPCCASP